MNTTKASPGKAIEVMDRREVELPVKRELERIEHAYSVAFCGNSEKEENRLIVSVFSTIALVVGGGVVAACLGVVSPVVPILTVISLPFTFPLFSLSVGIPVLGITAFLDRKKKKSLKLAYAIELGSYLYEKYGITLLKDPVPERRVINGDHSDLVYYGKMKKDGHEITGAIYRNKEGLAFKFKEPKSLTK